MTLNTLQATKPVESDELFGIANTSTSDLGDPEPLLKFLAQSVIETLAGIRDVEQSARWLTDGVYQQIKRRAAESNRARAESRAQQLRPNLVIGKTTSFSPRQGIVEGVVVVHNRERARAVAIRLEGYNGRWRAKSIAVL